MNKVFSDTGNLLLGLDQPENNTLGTPAQFAEYTIIIVTAGEGVFHADFASFAFSGHEFLFATPQNTGSIK
ncbi:AraC family transcriptional regulator, partial [Flavobacterium circumlabens]